METIDEFLGGRVRCFQPKTGFRAGTDSVLLAASLMAETGEHILELGSGSGVVVALINHRIQELKFTGLEIDPINNQRAIRNAIENKVDAVFRNGSVFDMPSSIKMQQFDHVITNPPFFDQGAHSAPNDMNKASAHLMKGSLRQWVAMGVKRLKPKGSFTIIHRAEFLSEILSGLEDMGAIRILPISANEGEPSKTIIVRAIRQSKAPLKILSPLYTEANQRKVINEVARSGYALSCLFE